MAAPTQAEVETQISNVVRLFENLRNYAGVTSSTNFLDNEDTLIQSLETEWANEVTTAVAGFRSSLAAANGMTGTCVSPLLLSMGRAIDVPEQDPQAIITRLAMYMADNSQAIPSRQFTFGSVAADGSNVGTGTIRRLTTDDRGYAIENCTAEAKEAVCIADQFSGATKNEELFQFTGADPSKDDLKRTGSGLVAPMRAVSARDSLVANSSWTSFSGSTSTPTAITDWTVGTIGNFEIDQTNYFRDDPGDGGTPAALKFTGSDSVTQSFSVRNVTCNASVPYWCSVAWNRSIGSGDGVITLTMGDQTVSVTLGSQTGWDILFIPLGTANWLRSFNKTDPVIKVELSSNTTGTVLIDDLMFTPFQPFDGTWYLPIGGATPFLFIPGTGDKFTWTDTEVGSILQHWFWVGFGRYLPHATGGSITWADPT